MKLIIRFSFFFFNFHFIICRPMLLQFTYGILFTVDEKKHSCLSKCVFFIPPDPRIFWLFGIRDKCAGCEAMTEEAWGQPSGLSVPGTFVCGYCLANVDVLLVGSGYLLIRRQTLLAAPPRHRVFCRTPLQLYKTLIYYHNTNTYLCRYYPLIY